MTRKRSLVIIATMVLGLASLAFGQQKIGKTADLTLTGPAQIGSVNLPAGSYEVKHRVTPTGHFMEFVRVTESNLGYEGSPTYYDHEVLATVPCNVQPLTATIGKTVIDKEGSRIARLEIKGENVAHNF